LEALGDIELDQLVEAVDVVVSIRDT